MKRRVWGWPTEEAWFMVAVLTLAAAAAGGWRGAAIMLGFFVASNVSGNLVLPEYRDVEDR